MSSKKMRLALLVDSLNVSKYVYDLAIWVVNQEDIELTCLIIQKNSDKTTDLNILSKIWRYLRKKGLSGFISVLLWRFILVVEEIKLKRSSKHGDHLSKFALDKLNLPQILISPNISKSGFIYRYNNNDVESVRNKQLDVIVRCGSGILKGDILNASTFGIISFHHGDNRVNRGGPAGFWEVYNQEPRTGFVIQRLTEELDGGDVIYRGYFPTHNFFLANQANLYSRSNRYMCQLLKKISIEKKLPDIESHLPYSNQLHRHPNLRTQTHYLFRLSISFLYGRIKYDLIGRKMRWGVAFQRSNWRNLVMWRATRIPNPPGRFLADPFVISKNGKDYCFVEDFDFSTHLGCISVVDLGESFNKSVQKVIAEPFHMSFPYLFEYNDKLYMIPETSQCKEIRVYECSEFPYKWSFRSVLMHNVSAADTMIFFRDGLWWLFTNLGPIDGTDHCSELSIFYSDNPLGVDWAPHKSNPIYIDPAKARNGGILFDGEQIFRVAQKQAFNQYGKEVNIFHIDKLDKDQYIETLVVNIKPNFFESLGTHHLHSNGNFTVFDYVVEEKV
jgi:hypothetical protein